MIDDNLRRANVTRTDVYGKLRREIARNFSQVLAFIFETTDDISVLLGSDSDKATLYPNFVENVIGHELLFSESQTNGAPR